MLLQIRKAEEELPAGFSVMETEDAVIVHCRYCGWEKIWYCHRFTVQAGKLVALTHRADCHLDDA